MIVQARVAKMCVSALYWLTSCCVVVSLSRIGFSNCLKHWINYLFLGILWLFLFYGHIGMQSFNTYSRCVLERLCNFSVGVNTQFAKNQHCEKIKELSKKKKLNWSLTNTKIWNTLEVWDSEFTQNWRLVFWIIQGNVYVVEFMWLNLNLILITRQLQWNLKNWKSEKWNENSFYPQKGLRTRHRAEAVYTIIQIAINTTYTSTKYIFLLVVKSLQDDTTKNHFLYLMSVQ